MKATRRRPNFLPFRCNLKTVMVQIFCKTVIIAIYYPLRLTHNLKNEKKCIIIICCVSQYNTTVFYMHEVYTYTLAWRLSLKQNWWLRIPFFHFELHFQCDYKWEWKFVIKIMYIYLYIFCSSLCFYLCKWLCFVWMKTLVCPTKK